ncbi:MAG: hypothetical protein AB1705_24895, partial [Verrucomicrobiota bacterium]
MEFKLQLAEGRLAHTLKRELQTRRALAALKFHTPCVGDVAAPGDGRTPGGMARWLGGFYSGLEFKLQLAEGRLAHTLKRELQTRRVLAALKFH